MEHFFENRIFLWPTNALNGLKTLYMEHFFKNPSVSLRALGVYKVFMQTTILQAPYIGSGLLKNFPIPFRRHFLTISNVTFHADSESGIYLSERGCALWLKAKKPYFSS